MKKKPVDYPLHICSICAEVYAASGFKISFAAPKILSTGKCSLCEKRLPVYAARLDGRPRPKPRRR